jgi:hypothetical protein
VTKLYVNNMYIFLNSHCVPHFYVVKIEFLLEVLGNL